MESKHNNKNDFKYRNVPKNGNGNKCNICNNKLQAKVENKFYFV